MYAVNFDTKSFNQRDPDIGREYARHIDSNEILRLWGNLNDEWKVTELFPCEMYMVSNGSNTIHVTCVYTDE